MRYIRVKWLHDYPDEPIDIYSEIDHEGWEVRKIDVFRDGYCSFADEFISIGSSGLR